MTKEKNSNHYATAEQRATATENIADLVKIASDDTARRPDGKFLSDHQIQLIDAHQDQIREYATEDRAIQVEMAGAIDKLEKQGEKDRDRIRQLEEAIKDLQTSTAGSKEGGEDNKAVESTEPENPNTNDQDTTDPEATEEEPETVEELNPGDYVYFKDREGNKINGVLVATTGLANEDSKMYHVRTNDGSIELVSFAYPREKEPAADPDRMPEIEFRANNYPELYARVKNLMSTEEDQRQLEAEGGKLTESMAAYVQAAVWEFMKNNPSATPEQIQQETLKQFVVANDTLEKDILDHIDGRKVDGQETKGRLKGVARRFNAWMDRHGDKVKKALLITGGVGLIATGAGAAAGTISLGAALGWGTAIGATKGALLGTLLQRHGSKNSEARNVAADVMESDEWKTAIANLDPTNRKKFLAIAEVLVLNYDLSAAGDHEANVKRTKRAAIIGAALGALAGSMVAESPYSRETIEQQTVPKVMPEVISHQIVPNELSGQVLDKLALDNNINLSQFLESNNITGYGESFTLPNGSTNEALIHAIERTLNVNFGTIGATHSYAGDDALTNDGIRAIFEAIFNKNYGGSTTVDVPTTETGIATNQAWTFVTAGSASLVGGWLAKKFGDRKAKQVQDEGRIKVNRQ